MDKRVLKIKTVDDMLKILKTKGRPFASFKKGDDQAHLKELTGRTYILKKSGTKTLKQFMR